MKWQDGIWITVLLLAGCQGQGMGIDPFGRTTIPPPPTGAAQPYAADPYYNNTTSAPPLVPMPGNSSSYSQPAQPRQPATSRPVTGQPAGWVAAGSEDAATSQNQRLRPVSPLFDGSEASVDAQLASAEGQPGGRAAPAVFRQQSPTPASNATIGTHDRTELSKLPLVRPRGVSKFSTSPARNLSSGVDSGRYGYASDYTWLKGRLEYVASELKWKLRYIPVDQTSDDFGGSVVLPALAELENYREGDFVTVRGRVAARDPDARDFATNYTVEAIEQQQ